MLLQHSHLCNATAPNILDKHPNAYISGGEHPPTVLGQSLCGACWRRLCVLAAIVAMLRSQLRETIIVQWRLIKWVAIDDNLRILMVTSFFQPIWGQMLPLSTVDEYTTGCGARCLSGGGSRGGGEGVQGGAPAPPAEMKIKATPWGGGVGSTPENPTAGPSLVDVCGVYRSRSSEGAETHCALHCASEDATL